MHIIIKNNRLSLRDVSFLNFILKLITRIVGDVQDHERDMTSDTVIRVRAVGDWLSRSQAGKALWHLSFGTPGMQAPSPMVGSHVSIAMKSSEIDLNGDIDKLRDQLKEYYT